MLVAPRRARVSDDAAERILHLVDDRGLLPGDRLPAERELAAHLKVGRTSIREGLRTLELLGLIEIRPSRGVYLKIGPAASLDLVIKSWIASHQGSFSELIELREALESQCAGLAAERGGPLELHAIDRTVELQRSAMDSLDLDLFVRGDNAFHDAVAAASRNGLLRQALSALSRDIDIYKMTTARLGPAARQRAVDDHVRIARALRARDVAGARSAMRSHIVDTPREIGVLPTPIPERAISGRDQQENRG